MVGAADKTASINHRHPPLQMLTVVVIIDTKLVDIINNQPNRTEPMKDKCVAVSVYLCVRGREW